MIKDSHTKLIISLILIFTLVLNIFPNQVQAKEDNWWNESFSNRQEINIPIDTSISHAKFQPIDIHVDFDESCYAKDENEHSIRVIYQNKGFFKELECQIYDLEKTDEKRIKSCNLVFLIPNDADGNEKYYLYYSKESKASPNYFDHVSVENSFYSYELISGFSFSSNFYQIVDDGKIIYDISQKGEAYGATTSQKVGKFKKDIKESSPQNGDLFASFDFYYYPIDAVENLDYASTSEKLISNEIIVDGNLMVEVGIISESNNGKIQTTGKYKYYHCPTDNKRIHVDIKHEAKDEIKLHKTADLNGVFARMRSGKVKSNSIKDLNFGSIYPYFHFYNEEGNLCEYPLNSKQEGTFKIIDTKDDIDLGEKTWVCFDEGNKGKAHALIMEKNDILRSGKDERDGIQINSFQLSYPNLPGIDSKSVSLQMVRNYYEKNGVKDNLIPNNYVLEYNAEFFSSEEGGYKSVEEESKIYKKLVEFKPKNTNQVSDSSNSKNDNSLTVYIHNDRSFSFGSVISALAGKKIPYINVELYKDSSLMSSGLANKLPIDTGKIDQIDDFKKISRIISIIDLKNFSLFKKVRFSNLEKGTYLVKVYKENAIFCKEKKYIGFKILEIDGVVKTHVYCKPEISSYLKIVDQNKDPIKDVKCSLKYDGVIVSSNFSDSNGNVELNTPLIFDKPYRLSVLYKGKVVFEKEMDLKIRNILSPFKKEIIIENYDLDLKVTDSWNQKPCFNFNMELRYLDCEEDFIFKSDTGSINDVYSFNSLLPGSYMLSLNYQKFKCEKEIDIKSSDETLDLVFLVEYKLDIKPYDLKGKNIEDYTLKFIRENKEVSFDSQHPSEIRVPPGIYNIKILSDDKIIGQRKVNIVNDNTLDVVTNKEPTHLLILTIFSIAFILVFGLFYIRKKCYLSFIKIFLIGSSILSLVYPWWMINGNNDSFKTSYKMFLSPSKIISFTKGKSVRAGEISNLPSIFELAFQIIIILIITGSVLLILNLFFERIKNEKMKKYTLLSSVFCFISVIIIFVYAAYQFASVSVGEFIGSGELNFDIPGGATDIAFSSSWGPDIGFYMVFAGTIFMLAFLVYKKFIRKKLNIFSFFF